MSLTREQKDTLVECLYEAAVNTNMPDVGNRQEYEQLVDDCDTSIALFFLEFARLWAIKQPWPVTPLPTDEREGDAPEQQGKVLIDQAELTALRDMAWRYQARSEQQS